ncbi:hypothetical protein SELMODRAFT_102403 [Selaginella moellendorffii]|uniref:non-specific serine/threonine protein kinase n=1 Tax=Selaginella moellendorffii TaxID=88036 RepID=D8RVH7_SELML|nr:hypothetical protein SELMODRAFT_102403 [Selaginella moellendorffii]
MASRRNRRACKFFQPVAALVMVTATMFIAAAAAQASCPVGFDYLSKFPSTLRSCDQTNLQTNVTVCCSALLNSLGIALAENLKTTGGFEFRDNATATACLADFQSNLTINNVQQNFVSTCFPVPYESPSRFIQSPDLCAGITTTADWDRVVGQTPMDISCAGDLSSGAACQSCVADAEEVVRTLNSISPGRLECLYFTVLYAAGVINDRGPSEPSTVECLLGINIAGTLATGGSSSRSLRIVLPVVLTGASVVFLVVIGGIIWKLYTKNRAMEDVLLSELGPTYTASNGLKLANLLPNTGLVVFKAKDLKAATNNFSHSKLVGEGASGRVYRGVLRRRGEVAVKVMKQSCLHDFYDDDEKKFLEQMKLVNSFKHKTLVQLRGCAISDAKQGLLLNQQSRIMVVYDYMPNGNLDNALFGSRFLSWPLRRKVAVDIAIAINYLHNELQPGVIHRDIKPSNILLDSGLNARLADFGLVKAVPAAVVPAPADTPPQKSATSVAGTPFFVAPEYALYGHLTPKSDVYGFGMVMLLLLSGRRPMFHAPEARSSREKLEGEVASARDEQVHVADWAWELVRRGQSIEVVDERVRNAGPWSVMERFVVVALLCAHPLVGVRIGIGHALAMLQGDMELPSSLPDRPRYATAGW